MGTAARLTRTLGVALALTALSAAPAHAQRFDQTYRNLVREAVSEFGAGNWAEARALFTRAHELSPNARTLRGMGMCAFELRDYEEAISLLEASLVAETQPLDGRLRRETEELLLRARSYIGSFTVVTSPPDASLLVDDAPPALDEEGRIVLPLGEHTFEARAPGFVSELRRITVRGGESLEVTLTLAPVPETSNDGRILPDVALGLLAGAAGALVFDVYAIAWLVEREGQIGTCRAPPEGFTCGNMGTLEDQRDAALASLVIATIVTVGLTAAGLLYWVLEPGEGAPEDAALACGPLGCAGRF